MVTNTLLIELGTEELPPKALKKLALSFKENLATKLTKADLTFSKIEWFATPRRLALKVFELTDSQPNKKIQKKGPSTNVAFKDGEPTQVALGWAKSNNIDLKDATILKTDKGEWLTYESFEQGVHIKELIPSFVEQSLSNLPIPKLMHWGNSNVLFVRPIHTLTMLYGTDLIEGTVLGLKSSNIIRGHRFMGEQEFTISNADDYPLILEEKGMVIADYERRKSMIVEMIHNEATKLNGLADIDSNLIEEVTSLVEYPAVYTAKFEEKFLQVPSEALVHTMKNDQKYFPVYKEQKLLPNFIFVSNIISPKPELVIAGNERVIRPRLSDAEFFFNTDKKQPLKSHFETLKNVIFQKQLGTLAEKSELVAQIAVLIAKVIGANPEYTETASLLSKCDLVTNMVMEFTDTQGIMGMHYARLEGYNEEIALALYQQYLPKFAGDSLPTNLVSCALSLAEKIVTLVGIFGINEIPKGDKDPFGLRRASIGLIRIIIEKNLDIDIEPLISKTIELYGQKLSNQNTKNDVIEYIQGRFKGYYLEQDIPTEVILSVLETKITNLSDFDKRVHAVNEFRTLEDAQNLASANKRVANIIAKSNDFVPFNESLLQKTEEIELYNSLKNNMMIFDEYYNNKNYTEALKSLAILREPIDNFFDKVIVNSDNFEIKNNRIALLLILRNLFTKVADISMI
jgi:glycyl-tRNA synthetase beta chain